MARKKISKSKRIQDYIGSNPEARNREVVDALAAYSVTPADVSNAKSQLKKKQLTASSDAPVAGTKRKKLVGTKVGTKRTASSSSATNAISLDELEASAGYIKSVGGLDRAQQLLQMVQQIQAM